MSDNYQYDDEYEYDEPVEELDDIDVDFESEPIDSAAYTMPQAQQLLQDAIDMVEAAPGLPMSASIRINRDEVLELLDDALSRLPDELRAARWLLKERDEFLAKTRRDGEEIIADAKARVAHMVQRTEVVKAADARARRTIEDAEAESRRMKREAEDYCDQKLASFEIVLDRITRAVTAGRQKLSATSILEEALAPEEEIDEDADAFFFDQDA